MNPPGAVIRYERRECAKDALSFVGPERQAWGRRDEEQRWDREQPASSCDGVNHACHESDSAQEEDRLHLLGADGLGRRDDGLRHHSDLPAAAQREQREAPLGVLAEQLDPDAPAR